MIQKLSLKNTLRLSVSDIFFLVFSCGFLLPKFNISGFYMSIPDIGAILLTLTLIINSKINKKIALIFQYEVILSLSLFFLLLVNFFLNNTDFYSFFYVLRILAYIAASLFMVQYLKENCIKILNISIGIIGIYIFLYCVYIILNISNYTIDQILYGYTKIRLKLPFEYSNSTSVPFGYLLSLIFTYIVFYKNLANRKLKLNIFLLAQIFTISRAALLSTLIIFFFKRSKIKYILIPILISFILYKTIEAGGLDKSSFDRVKYLIISIDSFMDGLPYNFFGFGLSPDIVFSNTNFYYYENIFSQALVNGGPLFLIIVLFMYLVFGYRILIKHQYIYIPVLIGNFFGGFNLLSTISLPIYFLLVYSLYELND